MRTPAFTACKALLICATLLAAAPGPRDERLTALDNYVAAPDSSFGWKLIRSISEQGRITFILELTSQTWRSAAEVDRPIWKHWLTIVKPDGAVPRTAILFIGGGRNTDPAPSGPSERSSLFAAETGTVAAELYMVPNQPLYFSDSRDKGRYEDDLIAYSRVRQFQTGDDRWLVRLPMVKSAVRAMDAVQQFLAGETGGSVRIEKFVVSGGSKRGWTTWLAAAVDPRVIAIMPTVIDALNSEAVTRHHFAAYGFFSPALADYVNHGIFPDRLGTPEYRRVLEIEDPYEYRHRDRMRLPKYIVNASGDQFFLPDNSRFYFKDLQGEKFLRYVPNVKHNLAGSDARESLLAFYQAVLEERPRPRFFWRKEKDGSLIVETEDRPDSVLLWQASNPAARDFRVDTIGTAYRSSLLTEGPGGTYTGRVSIPREGYRAFFVELVFEGGRKYPLKFTTDVSVVPDTLPFRLPGKPREK